MAIKNTLLKMNMYKFIYKKILSRIRLNHILKLIGNGKSVLDAGCRTLYLKKKIESRGMDYTAIDINPREKGIICHNIEEMSLKDNSFDITICSQVLEHTYNPIKAMKELKRVTRKKLIISIPNEPWFTFWRLMIWSKEHIWVLKPEILRKYLGEPSYEEYFFLKRYYIGIWDNDMHTRY